MFELNLETVVLCGVGVVNDTPTGQVRMASDEAGSGAFAVVPSSKRLPISKPAQPETDCGPRYSRPALPLFEGEGRAGTAVPRAGRLAGLGGVLRGRHPSMSRWSRRVQPAMQRIYPQWLLRSGPAARRMPGGNSLFGRGMRATLWGA